MAWPFSKTETNVVQFPLSDQELDGPQEISEGTPKYDSKMLNVLNDIRTVSRRMLGFTHGETHDQGRDLYKVYGYTRDRTFLGYFNVYRFQDIAARIIDVVPRSCWRDGAKLMIGEDEQLAEEMLVLRKKAKMFGACEKADKLNRLGRFSVLYVGVPDGRDPSQPLGSITKEDLENVFFTQYGEDGITITKWVTDPINPRWSLPEIYSLQVMNRGEKEQDKLAMPVRVHFSRIVHIAEGSLDGGLEGIPALEPILNRLQDLDKTIGGAAEAYFRNARGKYALEAERGFTSVLSDDAKNALDDEVTAFTNNWKDTMNLSGVSAKVLTTPHSDPVGTVRVALQAISGSTGIPIRILTGEGAGQLAGNEDKESYNQVIADRQNSFCEDILIGILDILENAGALTVPLEAEIEWPVATAMNEKDQSDVHLKNAEAFKYLAEGMDKSAFIDADPVDTAFKVLGLKITQGEARVIVGGEPVDEEDPEIDEIEEEV